MNKYEAIARIKKMKKPELEKLLLETLVFDDKSKINALCCNTNIMQYIEEIEKNLDLMELFLTDRNFNFQFQKMKIGNFFGSFSKRILAYENLTSFYKSLKTLKF